jgi:hypothetical protein
MRHGMPYGVPRPPDPVQWHEKLEASFTLVPANQPTVALIDPDEAFTRRLRTVIFAGGSGAGYPRRLLQLDSDGIRMELVTSTPSIGLAFDVLLRDPRGPHGGREWLVQSVTFLPNKGGTWFLQARPDGLDADKLDIVLRSNPTAAAETVDLTQIWQGELVYPGLPVIWPPDGVSRPTKFEHGTPPISASSATPPQTTTKPTTTKPTTPATTKVTTRSSL